MRGDATGADIPTSSFAKRVLRSPSFSSLFGPEWFDSVTFFLHGLFHAIHEFDSDVESELDGFQIHRIGCGRQISGGCHPCLRLIQDGSGHRGSDHETLLAPSSSPSPRAK